MLLCTDDWVKRPRPSAYKSLSLARQGSSLCSQPSPANRPTAKAVVRSAPRLCFHAPTKHSLLYTLVTGFVKGPLSACRSSPFGVSKHCCCKSVAALSQPRRHPFANPEGGGRRVAALLGLRRKAPTAGLPACFRAVAARPCPSIEKLRFACRCQKKS